MHRYKNIQERLYKVYPQDSISAFYKWGFVFLSCEFFVLMVEICFSYGFSLSLLLRSLLLLFAKESSLYEVVEFFLPEEFFWWWFFFSVFV